jgi:hypothetical protein
MVGASKSARRYNEDYEVEEHKDDEAKGEQDLGKGM